MFKFFRPFSDPHIRHFYPLNFQFRLPWSYKLLRHIGIAIFPFQEVLLPRSAIWLGVVFFIYTSQSNYLYFLTVALIKKLPHSLFLALFHSPEFGYGFVTEVLHGSFPRH